MITVDEIQSILGIDNQEDEIAKLLPIALSFGFEYTRNNFHTFETEVSGKFEIPNKLTVVLDNPLPIDAYIQIECSLFNNGIYWIFKRTGNEYEVKDVNFIPEESDIKLSIVKIPFGFKIGIAKLINSMMNSSNDKRSESIGDYSYSNATTQELLNEYLSQYKLIKVT